MFRTFRTSRTARNTFLAAGLALAGLAAAAPAAAQSTAGSNRSDEWQVTFAPYLYGAALEGTIAVRGHEAEVEVSAEELLEDLEAGVMGLVAARKGDWGVMGDVFYVELLEPVAEPPAEIEQTVGIFTLQGLRRINDKLDVTLGVRYTEIEAGIEASVDGVGIDVARTRDWTDPVVGVVVRTFAAGRWHGSLIADVGGFGAGSDLTWQLFPSVGFAVGEKASLDLGWRTMSVDYEDGEGEDRFAVDTELQGPVLGFVYQF